MYRSISVFALAAILLAFGVGATSARPSGEEMYYGRTSQGRAVALDIRGERTAGPSGKLAFLERQYLMLRGDTERPLPGGARFVANAVRVHMKEVGRANITAEIWFDARRSADHSTLAGSYRDVVTLQDGGKMETGIVRFTSRLWAASTGAPWSGKRSDGRPIAAAVTVLPSPEGAPAYTLTVPELTLPLSCTGPDGTSAGTTVNVTGLRAALSPARRWPPPTHGEYMFDHGLVTSGTGAVATATTANGAAVRVALAGLRLRWSGTGLVVSGAATAQGSGGATCTQTRVGFTLHPGS